MSLRSTILLLIAFTFIGLVIVLSVTLENTLLQHFNQEEYKSVLANSQRASGALEKEIDLLGQNAGFLAHNDQLYQAVLDKDQPLLVNYLPGNLFIDLQINLIILTDASGQAQYMRALDPLTGAELPFPEELQVCLSRPTCFFTSSNEENTLAGLLDTSHGILLLASAPLLQESGSGPRHGSLLIGRYLDQTALLKLGEGIQLPLQLAAMDTANLSVDMRAAQDYLSKGHDFYIQEIDEGQIGGFTLFKDIYGTPTFITQITMTRGSFQSGRFLANFLTMALIAVSSVFGLLTLILLETLVFRRLTRLEKEVGQIGKSGDASKRVRVTRKDEISSLSVNINQMLDTLEQVQQRTTELQTSLRLRLDELAALHATSQTLLGQLDLDTILQDICRIAVDSFNVDYAWIGTLTKNRSTLRPVYAYGISLESVHKLSMREKESNHPAVQAVLTRSIAFDGQSIEEHPTDPGYSMAALPLIVGDDVQAVLVLGKQQSGFFTEERVKPLQAFSNLASTAYQNADLFEQVRSGRERLQSLSLRLVEIQEDERRKLALELHDEIGQILTGLKLLLEMNNVRDAQQYQIHLAQALGLVNDLIGKVRQMSLDLRPAILDDLGLLPTLLWHLERYSQQTGIKIELEHTHLEGVRFPPEVETGAYRVIQEALTNTARYAGVDQAVVRIWERSGTLGIQVEDQGKGFDVDSMLRESHSSGLNGMRERVLLLGGKFSIDSDVGSGTCLTVFLPSRTARKEHA